ncbi:DNRLRE domain-containing protein [Chloroflexota bacterium]
MVAFSLDPVDAGGAQSIIRTFNVTDDTILWDGNGTQDHYNFGGSTYLRVESKEEYHTLLRFDTTSLSTGSAVSTATLNMYYYSYDKNPAGLTYYVNRLTENNWVEGTSDGAAETGAVDWIDQQHTSVTWTTIGGTNTATDQATAVVPASFGWMSWDVTNLVGYAVNNGVNAEWVIFDTSTGSNDMADFYSSENGSNIPYISVTFTDATWDSYDDSLRSSPEDNFASPEHTVYMRGTGFADVLYDVAYYDANGDWVAWDLDTALTSGNLDCDYLLTTDTGAAGDGNWHTLVQPASCTNQLPGTVGGYAEATGNPDTYWLVGNDQYYVAASAIPEFPTVVAAIVVIILCSVIYYWMRKKKLEYVKA